MGSCNQKTNKKFHEEKRITSRRTRMSDPDRGSRDDDVDCKRRGSRLSNTRNSLIMAKKVADSVIDHVSRHLSHSRIFNYQIANNPTYDSQRVSPEISRDLSKQVYSIPLQSNFLKNLSRSCVINLQTQKRTSIFQPNSNTRRALSPNPRQSIQIQFHSQQQIPLNFKFREMTQLFIQEITAFTHQKDVTKQDIETLYYLIERVQMHSLNLQGAVWLVKKYLKREGVDLLYQNERKITKETFHFMKTGLLSSNVQKCFWEIHFNPIKISYHMIFGERTKKRQFLAQIEEIIQSELIWIKTFIDKDNSLRIQFYLPYVYDHMLESHKREMSNLLNEKYGLQFKSINVFLRQKSKYQELVKHITLFHDDFDVWGNREFKTINCEDQETMFQYIRPVGWKRFGLKQVQEMRESDRVNVYLPLMTKHLDNIAQNSIDVGPNQNKFETINCGVGIICSPNINHLLPGSYSSISYGYKAKPISYSFDLISVVVENETRFYYLMLQASVEREKVRVPDNHQMQIFIVNDPNSIALHGVLVKEISEIEYSQVQKILW